MSNASLKSNNFYYEILVESHLDKHWLRLFEGLEMIHLPEGQTLLSGYLPDQAALHAVLSRIRDLGVSLLNVSRKTEGKGA